MDLKGKKLLILGGTYPSCEIIKQAKKQGVYVLVTDYLEESPGKKIADKSFMVSTTDVEAVAELIKEENIDGMLNLFTDSMVPYYQSICEKAGIPCYATKEQVDISTNKIRFKELCRTFDVPVVEDYEIQYPFTLQDVESIHYPVLIKPADSSGGMGIHICKSPEELIRNYKSTLSFSSSKKVLIERYMDAKEVTIYYLIQNGEICLCSMTDRHVKHIQNGMIPLPVAYSYPSKHLQRYQESLNSKVIEMFKSIDMQNGVLFMESFVENGNCVFHEMGYRFTTSLGYKIILKLNGINQMEMMINYALTGRMYAKSIIPLVNPNYHEWGCNITFLAKPGKVGSIMGVDEVKSLEEVIDVLPNYSEGDIIPESAIGTLKQVILKVFATTKTKEELAKLMDKIHGIIKVYSADGKDMLLDVFDTKELFD